MSKEAKIKKFKIAFLKPPASKELTKIKTSVEKAVKTASKSGSKQETAEKEVAKQLKELKKQDPEYYQKLLTYKMTKHWDEPKELKVWTDQACDLQDIAKAVESMMGPDPSEAFVSNCFFRLPRLTHVSKLCFEKAPERIVSDGVAYFEKNKRQPPGEYAPFQSKVALELFKKGERDGIPITMDICIRPEDAREMAKLDPSGYAQRFLQNAQPTAKMGLLKDPEVRKAILQDPETAKKISEGAPVLGFLQSVDKKVAKKKPAKSKVNEETAKCVFDELLSDDSSLGLTYYTNKFTSPSTVLCASKEETRKVIDMNRSGGQTDTMPDQPAMQCDELVTVLKYVMEAALGPESGVDCKHIVIPGMVLTVPINTLPGGLLKNTFGGNVYNDAGQLTKQVLFTGNDFGGAPNAHTYLEVGGVNYDAVLGTKGKEVTEAVAEEFGPWDKTGYESKAKPGTDIWVAKSKTTAHWVVKESDDSLALKAAANTNGFSTAYRLTSKLGDYAVAKPKTEDSEDEED